MLLLPYCSPVDNRVPVDKIDHYDDDDYDEDYHYHYHDSTDSKMWQGSLPHKNIKLRSVAHPLTYCKNIFEV